MTQVTIHLFTGCGLAKRHFLASWRRRLEPLQAEEFCLETGGFCVAGTAPFVWIRKGRPIIGARHGRPFVYSVIEPV